MNQKLTLHQYQRATVAKHKSANIYDKTKQKKTGKIDFRNFVLLYQKVPRKK